MSSSASSEGRTITCFESNRVYTCSSKGNSIRLKITEKKEDEIKFVTSKGYKGTAKIKDDGHVQFVVLSKILGLKLWAFNTKC